MSPSDRDGLTAGLAATTSHSQPVSGTGRTALAVPALTLLFHPRLDRVGERAVLGELAIGGETVLSRARPELAAPGASWGRPLADPYLSRRPLRLRSAAAGGVVLERGDCPSEVAADGETLDRQREIPAAELRRGVVLELAGRVVLLLHLFAPPEGPRPPDFGLVGDSDAMLRVRADIARVAGLDVSVLLCGETGTGKELVARALHEAGARRSERMVSVNLGALAPTLAASELFGARKGAFTGAVESRGYFQQADGGTLFLDEIGEAPAEIQAMLLRVLETREIFAVGSRTPQRVDVRLIAATDSDLDAQVTAGRFRAPLLHRLAGYEIALPPLRRRRDDVGRLLVHFLRQELAALGEEGRLDEAGDPHAEPQIEPGTVARLARFDWPGNVRQLRNVVRQLAIKSLSSPHLALGPTLEVKLVGGDRDGDETPTPVASSRPSESRRWRRPAEVGEDELIAALRANRWDLKATAAELHVSRSSLYALVESSPRVRTAGEISAAEIRRAFTACDGDLEAMVEALEVSKAALRRRLRELDLR